MKTASCPKWFFAATAAFVAGPASSLLHSEQRHVARQTLGRPSFVKLDASANRHKFTELEKLKAKRLSIRRRRVPEELQVDKLEMSSNGEEDLHMRSQVPDGDNSDTYHATIGLEYLYEAGQERHLDDLFHIVLMPSSFQKEYNSVEYVAESCSEILCIRPDKAYDLSLFAKHQGFSCLGTWTREECLSMGEQLLSRNLDCRVIPFLSGEEEVKLPDESTGRFLSESTSASLESIDSSYHLLA